MIGKSNKKTGKSLVFCQTCGGGVQAEGGKNQTHYENFYFD